MIRITSRQNEYLLELADGPKTTRDFVLSKMVSGGAAANVLKKLREAGLIRTYRAGRQMQHELTAPYSELLAGLIITPPLTKTLITEEEVRYAALLRNNGLIGQRLINQYHQKYPDRPSKSISIAVTRAKERGLCR